MYPPSFNCTIFVANSTATVDFCEYEKTPLTYFDIMLDLPTAMSPIRITIQFYQLIVLYFCKSGHNGYHYHLGWYWILPYKNKKVRNK